MNEPGRSELDHILTRLSLAETQDEEEEIGRGELASLLSRASPGMLDAILKRAKRDNRVRRALYSARYYSGLSAETCRRIDEIAKNPFPGAGRRRR